MKVKLNGGNTILKILGQIYHWDYANQEKYRIYGSFLVAEIEHLNLYSSKGAMTSQTLRLGQCCKDQMDFEKLMF